MIIFISAILYTVQLIVQHCNCLNLIDLPQGREAYSAKWRLASRAPEMYELYPRKRGMKPYLRRYMLGNDRPGDKILSKVSRRVYEDEKDANLKNKIKSLVDQTVQDTQDKIKEIDELKDKYTKEPSCKAGFLLSLVQKSREVLNELFDLAIKHRDQWQALEQLKIFEMIVNTNIETNHLLKQLQDLQAGRDIDIHAKPNKLNQNIKDVKDIKADGKDFKDGVNDVKDVQDVKDDMKDVQDVKDDIKDDEKDLKDVKDGDKDDKNDLKDVKDGDKDDKKDLKDVKDGDKDDKKDLKDVKDGDKDDKKDVKDVKDVKDDEKDVKDVKDVKDDDKDAGK